MKIALRMTSSNRLGPLLRSWLGKTLRVSLRSQVHHRQAPALGWSKPKIKGGSEVQGESKRSPKMWSRPKGAPPSASRCSRRACPKRRWEIRCPASQWLSRLPKYSRRNRSRISMRTRISSSSQMSIPSILYVWLWIAKTKPMRRVNSSAARWLRISKIVLSLPFMSRLKRNIAISYPSITKKRMGGRPLPMQWLGGSVTTQNNFGMNSITISN